MRRSSKSLILADTSIQEGEIWKVEINKKNKFFLVAGQKLFIIEPARLEGSCLINNYLVGDPRLYSISRFDPLLLLVPNLLDNCLNFRDLSDILQESNLGFLRNKEFLDLEKICDVKLHEGSKYIRIDKERYEAWINCKLQALTEYFMKSSPILNGSVDLNVAGRKLAIGILIKFLPVEIVMAVDSRFTVEQVLNVGRLFLKRSDEVETNASLKMKAKSLGADKKKINQVVRKTEQPKLGKGQTTLNFLPKKK